MALLKQASRGAREIWWMNPIWIVGALVIPAYTIIYLIPHVFGWDAVVLRGFPFFTFDYFLLGLVFLLAMLNGAVIGKARLGRPLLSGNQPPRFNRYYLDFLALATIAAYLIWFRGVLFSPSALWSLLTGAGGVSRVENRTIGGVTTATEFGVAFIVLYLSTIWGDPKSGLPVRFKLYFFAILFLTLFRVFAWGERVALAEVMVPIFLLYVCFRVNGERPIVRILLYFLPLVGVLALIGYFGITEYFRSWSTHYQFQEKPFWDFIALRLTSYYYTALNNGAGLLTVMDWPNWQMIYVLGWLRRFPLLIGASVSYVLDTKAFEYEEFLTRYGDPEFNNPSGIFTVFLDVGVAGALCVAALIGVLAGALHNSMREGGGLGVVLYPVFFVQFMELFRYLYLGNQRGFPVILAMLVGCLFFRDRTNHKSDTAQPERNRSGFAPALRRP